ncbi:hypothetical protein ID866_9526, partial [Astraeus odoratus]
LSHIPIVGPSGFLGLYWVVTKFSVNCQKYLREGYNRYKPRPFRVLTPYGWVVILNQEHLEDIANKSQAELSLDESISNVGSSLHIRVYIKDEMVNGFSEILDIRGNEWKSVPAFQSVRRLVSRTSNRVFVGLPLCRDPDWNDFTIELTAVTIEEATKLCLLPAFLVPWVARYVTGLDERTKKGATYLGPMIRERQRHMDTYVDKEWLDKPNDFLQWCLDAGKESSVMLLTQRILLMNFATNHVGDVNYIYPGTLPFSIQSTLYLPTHHIQVAVQRLALKDIKLSDGTFLPKGTAVQVAINGVHHDPGVYNNPDVFEPFRFADLGEGYGHQMVTVNSASLSFGYGKVAWYVLFLDSLTCQSSSVHSPGRFLAAAMLKMMLAYIVLSFDVKLDASGLPPRNLVTGWAIEADPKARVMFRKRSDP